MLESWLRETNRNIEHDTLITSKVERKTTEIRIKVPLTYLLYWVHEYFKIITCSHMCLLGLLGLTLFASPLAAQVFDSGPSDPALFDNVRNVPTDPDIGDDAGIGGSSSPTVQLNIFDGGLIGNDFRASANAEVNISGG